MSIDVNLGSALAGLRAANAGIDLVSRNIANASNPGYTRKTQRQSTGPLGQPVLERIQRNIDTGLQKTARDTRSNAGMLAAQHRHATEIALTFGTPADATSLSALTSALGNAFQSLATQPESPTAYDDVANAAERVATGIRALYQRANHVSTNATNQLSESVGVVNDKLAEIDSLNKKIIANQDDDTSDLEDQRDEAIMEVAERLDITAFQRPDGGISVYTKSGIPLVDVSANVLSSSLVAGTGPMELLVQVDSGSSATLKLPSRSGEIAGLIEVINTSVPRLQAQLDDFAGTLTTSLNAAGVELFNDGGATTFDPVATPSQAYGYGNRISLNNTIANDPPLIRDGSSATPLAPADTTFIDAAVAVFQSTSLTFSGPGMKTSNGLAAAASDIITGHSNVQSDFEGRLQAEQSTLSAIETVISSDSGVNLDIEFSNLLHLQQAYAANARIVTAAQNLFNALLVAAGGNPIS